MKKLTDIVSLLFLSSLVIFSGLLAMTTQVALSQTSGNGTSCPTGQIWDSTTNACRHDCSQHTTYEMCVSYPDDCYWSSAGTCTNTWNEPTATVPTPPVRSNGLPQGTLPAGTTQTTVSLTTDTASECRFSSLPGTAYYLMTRYFTPSNERRSHSYIYTGLSNGEYVSVYVRCRASDGGENTDDYVIAFSIATTDNTAQTNSTGSTGTSCAAGYTWDAASGSCQPAPTQISSISAQPELTSGAWAHEIITWRTDPAALRNRVQYADQTFFSSNGFYNLMQFEDASAAAIGHRIALNELQHSRTYHYRVCSANSSTAVETCSSDLTFTTAAQQPPDRYDGTPTGTIPAASTAVIQIKTRDQANCRISTAPGVPYRSANDMMHYSSGYNGSYQEHNYTLSVISGASYTRYIRCASIAPSGSTAAAPENQDDYVISFTVAPMPTACPAGYVRDSASNSCVIDCAYHTSASTCPSGTCAWNTALQQCVPSAAGSTNTNSSSTADDAVGAANTNTNTSSTSSNNTNTTTDRPANSNTNSNTNGSTNNSTASNANSSAQEGPQPNPATTPPPTASGSTTTVAPAPKAPDSLEQEYSEYCMRFGILRSDACEEFLRYDLDPRCLEAGHRSPLTCETYLRETVMKRICEDDAPSSSTSECAQKILEQNANYLYCGTRNTDDCLAFAKERFVGQIVTGVAQRTELMAAVTDRDTARITASELAGTISKQNIPRDSFPIAEPDDRVIRLYPTKPSIDISSGIRATVNAAYLVTFDTDADTIPDDIERILGTDLQNPDSDNDGYSDADELRSGYSPLAPGGEHRDPQLAPTVHALIDGTIAEEPTVSGMVDDAFAVRSVVTDTASRTHIISGSAKPNTLVLIYLYSKMPMVLAVQTDESGNFVYHLRDSILEGKHTVYVAVTDETGKLKEKSSPLAFIVSSAQAETVSNFLQDQPVSPYEARGESLLKTYIVIGASLAAFALAGVLLFIIRKRERV